MALEMKASSRWWYSRFLVSGKLRRFPLMEKRGGKEFRLEIKGRRPASLKHWERGDDEFRQSYHRALAVHDRLREDIQSRRFVEDQSQRIIEAKTGTRLDFVKIEAIPEAWAAIPRKRPPSAQYVTTAKAKLQSFVDFMRHNHPEAEDLASIRTDHVRAYLEKQAARGISPRTWNIALKLLKTVFVKLEPNADAYRAFLKNVKPKDEDTVHREPFNDDEIDAILEAARADEILRGPVVTAVCTAMRRGDCALLKWASVDMNKGFIEIRTSKTGETAEIPILPMLHEELNRLPRTSSEYVFPLAAALYQNDPHALNRRLRDILTTSGFVDVKGPTRTKKGTRKNREFKPVLPCLPLKDLRLQGLAAIAAGDMIEAKRERMGETFTAYLAGKSLPAIARELGMSKSTVSLHLNEIEGMVGAAVVRRPPPPMVPSVVRGALRAEHVEGKRLKRGSVRGWHSFRVAFVTRALSGGMPEELVRRVTGHTAIDVVREHYFKPGREEFRREFEKAMPKLTMNGAKSRDEQLREIIEGVTPKSCKRDKARLLAVLDGETNRSGAKPPGTSR